jgi:hypothetical protein
MDQLSPRKSAVTLSSKRRELAPDRIIPAYTARTASMKVTSAVKYAFKHIHGIKANTAVSAKTAIRDAENSRRKPADYS